MAQSPNTQEVKNPFTSGDNQQSAVQQREEGTKAPGSGETEGVTGAAVNSAQKAADGLGEEGGASRHEIETKK